FFDYQTADYKSRGVDYKIDIMNMPVKNEIYDFFICSHVLEHVEGDGKAIRELYRITKTGGCGILMTPIIIGLEATIEDKSIATEDERWKMFGQNDHVRLYAHSDYMSKIKQEGFGVNELGIEHFGADIFKLLGLKKTSILYIVKKS
ncbi:MAG: methyltransferase domain-containing protein, partial [Desulfobacterales bacterium]|nr:methyltransferase domain-containing protein [Desulfobacterales bacterium]